MGEATTTTPIVFSPVRPVFRRGHVYGFTMDDVGVAYLVRLRVMGREG